ncbi:MAG: PocR ligand-binding domain-containing protein [Bacillota bacterium]
MERIRPEVDLHYFNKVLKSFCAATGLTVEAVGATGHTLFFPEGVTENSFCRLIRENPKGAARCRKSYRRACLETAKWDEPYFFRCHAGLVIWAVPMKVDQAFLGSIICGKVLMWEPDTVFWEELNTKCRGLVNMTELKKRTESLPVVPPRRAQAAADMLFAVISFLLKRNLFLMEQRDKMRRRQEQLREELAGRRKRMAPVQDKPDQNESYWRDERELLRLIRLGDKERAVKALESLLGALNENTGGDGRALRMRINDLVVLASRAAVDGGANVQLVMEGLAEFNGKAVAIDNMDQLALSIKETVAAFLDSTLLLARQKHLGVVMEARRFIMQNYDRNISLEDIARHLYVSPSYLCRLFRSELNITVHECLNQVRIEKAVELIKRRELNIGPLLDENKRNELTIWRPLPVVNTIDGITFTGFGFQRGFHAEAWIFMPPE